MGGMHMAAHDLYKKAYDAHYEDNDHDRAVEGYKKVIELYPDSAEAGFARKKLPELKIKKNKDRKTENIDIEVDKLTPVGVQLTTSNTMPGYKVAKTIGFVSAESASEIHLSSNVSSKNGDNAGKGGETIEYILRKTRMTCIKRLKKCAETIGANAVIDIKLSHNKYRVENDQILCTVVYGTAILVVL